MTKKLSLSEENLLELETDKNTKEKEIEMVWSLYFFSNYGTWKNYSRKREKHK